MFREIEYLRYDREQQVNIYRLVDTCFIARIMSPVNSPSIEQDRRKIANAMTLLSLIRYYESANRNVAHNVALYFNWLWAEGFMIDKTFVQKMLNILDLMPGTNVSAKYYHSIIWYLQNRFGMCT